MRSWSPNHALLPADQPLVKGVRLAALRRPEVVLRAYAVTRPGRETWAPLRLVTRLLAQNAAAPASATFAS